MYHMEYFEMEENNGMQLNVEERKEVSGAQINPPSFALESAAETALLHSGMEQRETISGAAGRILFTWNHCRKCDNG